MTPVCTYPSLNRLNVGELVPSSYDETEKAKLIDELASSPTWGSDRTKAISLNRYLDAKRNHQHDIHQSNKSLLIDLSAFDLGDVRVNKVNFSGTLLSLNNLNAIIAGGGDLTGAVIRDDIGHVQLHCFDGVKMDKAVAIQLIKHGADARAVLINYLASERSRGVVGEIDVVGLDLSNVNPQGINLNHVDLNHVQFATPFNSINGDKLVVTAHFQQDLLALLSVFSKIVASLLVKSNSADIAADSSLGQVMKDQKSLSVIHDLVCEHPNSLAMEFLDFVNSLQTNFTAHTRTINDIRSYTRGSPANIETSLKTSTGNCSEMAVLSKYLLDLYLSNALQILGYSDFGVITTVMKAHRPCDHTILSVDVDFSGESFHYVVDPWSDGMAKPREDALQYFYTRKPDRFTNPGIKFTAITAKLNAPHSELNAIFNKFHIKELLNNTLKENKEQFVGYPWKQSGNTGTVMFF